MRRPLFTRLCRGALVFLDLVQVGNSSMVVNIKIKINYPSFPPTNSELTARVVETANDVER